MGGVAALLEEGIISQESVQRKQGHRLRMREEDCA